MNKKNTAILVEIIPILSAIIPFILIMVPYVSKVTTLVVFITIILSFLGFAFFFIGKKLYKGNKIVQVLGILDWLTTIYVIVLYLVAIFSFGL